MIDNLNKQLRAYDQKWQQVVDGRKDAAFFTGLKPVAVGWKTEDRTEYDRLVTELRDQSDLVIEKWMNGRWIAKIHLRDTKLTNGVEIVKIMQRRAASTDATGLDHVDFYTSTEPTRSKDILKAEPGLKWTEESNDAVDGYDWLSVWFDGTEAKIKSDTVLDIIRYELNDLNHRITQA